VTRGRQQAPAALSNSESLVLEQELILKNALTRTGTADAQIAAVRIVPTDHIEVPQNEQLTSFLVRLLISLLPMTRHCLSGIQLRNTLRGR
jgi:hypothetical protein